MGGDRGGGRQGGSAMSRTRGPQGRATPQQSFGEFGSTPGGGQPNNGATSSMDSRLRDSRYNQRPIATRPATVGNIATALAGALPGGGLVQGAIGLAKGTPGDPYSGPTGKTTGFSHEGNDRALPSKTTRRARLPRTGLAYRANTPLGGAPGGTLG